MKIQAPIFVLFILLFVQFSCTAPSPDISTPLKSMIADSAMVATSHPLAAQAGLKILKLGGNAIDAIIATQFTLAVVNPRAGNIGGGGFLLYRDKNGLCQSQDHREKAPLSAHAGMYLDNYGNPIPGASLDGATASAVPGTVKGLWDAWQKHSALKNWAILLEDAIYWAENGFFISADEADRLNYYQQDFIKINGSDIPFVRKNGWKAGDKLLQPQLASTLKKIQSEGANGFYTGAVAEALIQEMAVHNGYITAEDLQVYQVKWRKPIVENYRNYRLFSMPPPSSGGIALVQILKMIEPYPLKEWGRWDIKTLHLLIEAEARAYADRSIHLGDQDFHPVPLDSLLDDDYLKERFADFSPLQATGGANIKAGEMPVLLESFETTHTSVVDQFGNAAALTTTINSNYGSKLFVKKAGFFMNNEMDDFSIKPGVPNQFGLVGSTANAIAPEKRMLSSMTPTIIEKDGQLFLVLGSPGGSTIITSVLQTFLNMADFDMNVADAVSAGRFHHQWVPDEVWVEEGLLDSAIIHQLEKMGHHIVSKKVLGAVKAITVRADGKLEGVGDPRKPDDAVAGY